jgi:hypothetical protein
MTALDGHESNSMKLFTGFLPGLTVQALMGNWYLKRRSRQHRGG